MIGLPHGPDALSALLAVVWLATSKCLGRWLLCAETPHSRGSVRVFIIMLVLSALYRKFQGPEVVLVLDVFGLWNILINIMRYLGAWTQV